MSADSVEPATQAALKTIQQRQENLIQKLNLETCFSYPCMRYIKVGVEKCFKINLRRIIELRVSLQCVG